MFNNAHCRFGLSGYQKGDKFFIRKWFLAFKAAKMQRSAASNLQYD
jgi:hypothetical protein